MAPVVHGLEDKYGDQLDFVFFDIDDPNTDSFQTAVNYDSRWRPYIMILDGNGEVMTTADGVKMIWIGVQPGETLELALLDALSQ
ncbi:MAG: hypothetical protein OEZ02_08870 [Anaerolineae bacterium]|nr:hypothetical protein [Anaerolineae bacterium]